MSVVIERPIGATSMPRCTADVFEPDVLTITSIDDGVVVATFQPDDWCSVAVYADGSHGSQLAFGLKNSRGDALRADALRQLRSMQEDRHAVSTR